MYLFLVNYKLDTTSYTFFSCFNLSIYQSEVFDLGSSYHKMTINRCNFNPASKGTKISLKAITEFVPF